MPMVSPTPLPRNISTALDARGLYGPEVDVACGTWEGNPAGDVDAWENPADPALPTPEQVRLLAKLTNYPVGFFYRPLPEPTGPMFVCDRKARPGNRCHVIDARPIAPVIPIRPEGQGELFAMAAKSRRQTG